MEHRCMKNNVFIFSFIIGFVLTFSADSFGQHPNHFTGSITTKESTILTGKLFVNGRQVKNDFEIGVFVNNQSSEILAGACVIGDKIASHYFVNVYGDLPETTVKEGPVDGDELTIRIWNPSRNTQDYDITLIYEPCDGLARPDIPPVWYGNVTQGFLNIYARDKNAPVISKIQNQYTMEDVTTSPIEFIAFDPHTFDLTLTVQSSNQTLIPENNIQRHTSNMINHELILTPVHNQYGQSMITITATNPEHLTDEALFYLTVIPVNDAPILAQSTSLTIASIDEDSTDHNGISIQSLISNLTISDVDSLSKQGIAVYSVDDTFGGWQYSVNGGNTWSHFHAIPNQFLDMSRMSRLLDASESHRIRFVPDENCYGITTLLFRAWDQSTGVPGKTADTTDNGATTAFSSETGRVTLRVNPVNDLPQMSDFIDLTTFQDIATEPVLLTIIDIETPADQLNITFESSDPHVVDISHISIAPGETAHEKYITIKPLSGQSGKTIITVIVNDGINSVSESFALTVIDNVPADLEFVCPIAHIDPDYKFTEIIIEAIDSAGRISKVEFQMFNGKQYLYPDISNLFDWKDGQFWILMKDNHNNEWSSKFIANWEREDTYILKVRAYDQANNISEIEQTLKYGNPTIPSKIELYTHKNKIILGEPLQVSGRISKATGEMIERMVPVEISYSFPGVSNHSKVPYTNSECEFSESLDAREINHAGIWFIQARWQGTNEIVSATSEAIPITVQKAVTHLTLDSPSVAIKSGQPLSVSGKITPKPYLHSLPTEIPVRIQFIHENSGEHRTITVTTHDHYGHFNLPNYDGFNKLGNWRIQASLSDHPDYQEGQSQNIVVKVIETEGYAILLQGFLDNHQGADSHYKTLSFVYDTLIHRGLDPDDIYCYSNYVSDRRVDGIPTQNTISNVLNNEILDKMNIAPSNVYIILIDHGMNEKFYIGSQTITHTQLAGWINDFQNNLASEDAKTQEIVCILGFCHSGSFIQSLSGENRIIITSSDANEDSFKGPMDRDNNIREGEFFIAEFFKQVALGMNVRTCFEEAVIQTELYTYSADQWQSFPYSDHALQHPLLEDDGNGIGSNMLSDMSGDGILSENIFMGAGKNLTNDSSRISIVDVSKTQFLEHDKDQLTTLQACVDNPNLFSFAWIQIKPPHFQPYSEDYKEQLELNFENIPAETIHNNCATWENLSFEQPGLYQIFYFAKDSEGNITSDMSSRVYKRIDKNSPPYRFQMLQPEDYHPAQNDFQNTVRTSVLLEWQYKNEPDGDPFDYTILLSKGNDDFNDPIEISGIETNFYYLTSEAGIEDMTIYYWKVRAIDIYGEFHETSPRAFRTNNYANTVTGFIKGCVVDDVSRQVIPHATVKIRALQKNLKSINGFYKESLDAGAYIIDISACGFQPLTGVTIHIDQDIITRENFKLTPLYGDLNCDTVVDIIDSLKALYFFTQMDLSPETLTFYGADITKDQQFGLEELVHIFKQGCLRNR